MFGWLEKFDYGLHKTLLNKKAAVNIFVLNILATTIFLLDMVTFYAIIATKVFPLVAYDASFKDVFFIILSQISLKTKWMRQKVSNLNMLP